MVLSQFVLLSPDQTSPDPEWVAYSDLKKDSHFTNVNFFHSDTELAIEKSFSGSLAALKNASQKLEAQPQDMEISYDLSVRFEALPHISLLLLFNDGDEEFPAQCKVLYQQQAEQYLDPESLAIIGATLAKRLKSLST